MPCPPGMGVRARRPTARPRPCLVDAQTRRAATGPEAPAALASAAKGARPRPAAKDLRGRPGSVTAPDGPTGGAAASGRAERSDRAVARRVPPLPRTPWMAWNFPGRNGGPWRRRVAGPLECRAQTTHPCRARLVPLVAERMRHLIISREYPPAPYP